MAHSEVLKSSRAVPEWGLTERTFPPQLSESWSRREDILGGGAWEGRPDTTRTRERLDRWGEGEREEGERREQGN